MSDIDPTKARQGRKGSQVLIILVVALALCLIIFVGLGFYGSSQPDENVGGASQSDASTEAAAPPEGEGGGDAVVTPGQGGTQLEPVE